MWEDYLKTIYYDPKSPASFSGVEKLYDFAKSQGQYDISKYHIRQWLQGQDAYTLTRQVRRRFRRNRVVVDGIDSQWDADLMDLSSLQKDNQGFRYGLVTIDIFSRFVNCRLLKQKTGSEVTRALESIVGNGRTPNVLRTDKGSEFTNGTFQRFCRGKNIKHILTQNEVKASYAERVQKTLKMKIYRYISENQNKSYRLVLDSLVDSYNHTTHRSLGTSPSEVGNDNEDEVRLQQYLIRTKYHKEKRVAKRKYMFKIGDLVRLTYLRGTFEREYQQRFTGEIFKIQSRYRRDNTPVYRLTDWLGDEIEGTYYFPELQRVKVDENTRYKVERIIKRRKYRGRKEVLVRWLHWPKKFDSWILESEVKEFV